MRKFLLIFVMMMAIAGYTQAQVIENFESLKMNIMLGGAEDSSSFTVMANPDPTGVNTSGIVVKFLRDKDGVAWGGFYATVNTPIDFDANRYVHAKVWKPRISPVKFKIEGGATGNLEVASMNPQTLTNQWEEMVFDFTDATGPYSKIVFFPDFEDPLILTEDIVIYFDDFYVNDDPTPGSAAVQVIEDYEHIPLNLMLNGPDDLSTMTLVPNPDATGVNLSTFVIEFFRDKDGYPWDGFWSNLPASIDVTTNKYIHVKVWKPRISQLKFKIEKTGEQHEIFSLNEQTLVNAWEDIVFDFSAYTGTWNIIAFLPDYEDPVTLTEDITIYFDDIILSSDPNPFGPPQQNISVDMTESGMTAGEPVWISGAIGGIYGTWATPGDNLNNQMFDNDGDGIYTISMSLPDGLIAFKFFWANGWDHGDPAPGGDRTLQIIGDMDVTYKWGAKAPVVTLNVDMHGSGLTAGQTVYFSGTFGGIYGTWNEPGTNLNNILTDIDGDSIYTVALNLFLPGAYQFKFFKGNGWAGGEWEGDPNRLLNVLGDTTVTYNWGEKPAGIRENPLANKVSVYPVPFNNTIMINTIIDLKTVIISTSYGQEVARFDNLVPGLTSFNTSQLANGMYFITFYGKNGDRLTQKLLKN